MKKLVMPLLALVMSGTLVSTGCKNKKAGSSTEYNTDTKSKDVEINSDASLRSSLNNILREYENVQAEVNDGVVTLKGSVRQAELQPLMSRVQELKPKKVNNELVII